MSSRQTVTALWAVGVLGAVVAAPLVAGAVDLAEPIERLLNSRSAGSPRAYAEAAEAVAQWLLTEDAQKLIMQGFMHSVLAGSDAFPEHSIPTDELISKDLGVDWEKAYKSREDINNLWTEKVTQ